LDNKAEVPKAAIKFENRVVAFIDLLGFTALVAQAENPNASMAEMQSVVDLLGAIVPEQDKKMDPSVPLTVLPVHTYISDSIILSAPLEEIDAQGRKYDGLVSIVIRSIQISHALLKVGHLVRGGITIGSVWHDGANIIGSGYIRACHLEKDTSHPRIALAPEAFDHWQKSAFNRSDRSVKTFEGIPMVNGLHDYFIDEQYDHGGVEDTYAAYGRTIEAKIANEKLPESARNKWSWFLKTFKEEHSQVMKWKEQ
jgi:hypothetical protein